MFFNLGVTRVNVFQPWGYSSGCQEFRRNRLNLSVTKFATTLLCGYSNIDTWIIAQGSMSNAYLAAEGSAAAKRLKNTALCLYI